MINLSDHARLPIKQDFEDMRKVIPLDVVEKLMVDVYAHGQADGYKVACDELRKTEARVKGMTR